MPRPPRKAVFSDRPVQDRRLPLAAPAADLPGTSHVERDAPDPTPSRPAKRPRMRLPSFRRGSQARWLLIGLVLIAWSTAIALGGLRPVVVVEPLELHGKLGRVSPSPAEASAELVRTIETVRAEAETPVLELWIGAGSLDGSQPNFEEPRLLPAVRRGNVQYTVQWSSREAWGKDLPTVDVIAGALRQMGWALTGHRTHRVSGTILAAMGRPSMRIRLDGHELHNQQLFGETWQLWMRPVASSLLLEVEPASAAVVFLRGRRPEAALEAIGRMLTNRTRSDDALAHALQYLVEVEAGLSPEDAHRRFDEVVQHAPLAEEGSGLEFPGARRTREGLILAGAVRGYERIKHRDYGGALRVLQRFQAAAPEDPQLLMLLSQAHLMQGDMQEAMGYRLESEALLQAAGLVPQSGDEGDNQFWRVSMLDPDHPLYIGNRAVERYLAGDLIGAADRVERALTIRSNYRLAAVMSSQSVLQTADGKYEDADAGWRQVQASASSWASTYIHRARIPFLNGDYAAARTLLEEGRTNCPGDARLPLELGYLCAILDDAAASEEAFAAAIALDAPNRCLLLYQGHAALILHRLSTAEQYYMEAIDAGEPMARIGLAQVRFNQGRFKEAADAFEGFSADTPGHVHAMLWAYLSRRLQQPPDPVSVDRMTLALRTYVAAHPEESWPADLMRIQLGENPIGADAPNETEQRWRDCLEHFHEYYASQLVDGPGHAESHRQHALDTGLIHFYEYLALRPEAGKDLPR